MAEVLNRSDVKIIAFYLPQFHSIPENDIWWEKGFTEWTNVRRASPLFNGHDQPRIPLNREYYNLLDDNIKIKQVTLAKEYGIFGFCYYHYWFRDGKKLLEKPAEQMLQNPKIDFPFCFSWANENWSKKWDGGNHDIIMKQEYGGKEEWEKHLQYLLPFFRDHRYITVNGRPLFIIYKPEQIIDIYQMTKFFKKRIREEGFPDICLAFQYPTYYSDMYYRSDIFDYRIAFEPVYSRDYLAHGRQGTDKRVRLIRQFLGEEILSKYRKSKQQKMGSSWKNSKRLVHMSYNKAWESILTNPWTEELLPGAFVDWDNTPRNKKGVVYDGFTIEAFERYFSQICIRAKNERKPIIFINAWNEWAEGAYLEPDEKYGYQKLEAIRRSVQSVQ